MYTYLAHGLIYTDIHITYNGCSKVIKNIVIDTGAAESIISSTALEDIGIESTPEDETAVPRGVGGTMPFFVRLLDELKIGDTIFRNISMDIGNIDPTGELNGLIGLDILKTLHAVFDVEIPIVFLK